ncbi:choice-of-anchor Q domain-containing protein [Tolypothrix bouteillei VB521301_2]|uniref:choice-of-anchor Q domain-containing protein n=1 Tax=Tolypothrix bouteillei TaxID=1246981 RepID=UPI0038B4FA98
MEITSSPIKNGQTVNIEGLTLTNGSSEFGGGIYNEGTLAIANSIISGNQATQTGGGIYNKGTLTVTNSTINGNTAQIVGGGIGAATGFSIANSTISGNTAKFGGGAIGDVIATGTVNISNTTIYNNFSNAGGGGIDLITLTVNIKNSILAGNKNDDGEQNFASPGDGKIISFGHNIESGTDAGFTSTGDLQNTNPLLAPLADNGGFTPTHALLPGSPAINKGDNTNALTLDQRGNPRIIDGTVDIGAFEVNPYPPKVSFGAAQYNKVEGNSDTTVTIPVTLDSLPSTTVTVPITISLTSTATSGSDYFFAPTTLSFNPGVTGTGLTQQLSITIKADNLPENDETIVFNFGTIQGAVAGTINTTTLTIAANDASPDTLIGTNGSDEIFGLSSNDIVIGKLGSDTIDAGEGEDTVFGDEITPIVDILGENNDTIRGGNGADRIFGGEGDDKLYGDAGNDMIWGNDGSDFLWGGEGNDYLTGGQGNDVFVVSSNGGIDTINDFQEYDTIGLIGGLTYSQLSITQILNNTFIFESSSQKILAILTGVQASTLTSSRFQNLTVDV